MEHIPNILIVDDTPENLFFLESVIKKFRVNLYQASSGSEALQKTDGIDLALAILDVRMAEMNGYDLALKINEKRADDKVPVIFLTAGYINEGDVFKGYSSGAIDYIFKPVDVYILKSKINVFLDIFKYKQTIIREAELLKKSTDELGRVNSELIKSEEKYRRYIRNAPDTVFITDETGSFIEVNKAACNITGYSEEELLEMSISDILSEEPDKGPFVKPGKVIHTAAFKSDLLFKHKSGAPGWWSVEIVKLEKNRFIVFAKDITERKAMEQALKSSQFELEMQNNEVRLQNEELLEAIAREERISLKYNDLYDFAPMGYFTIAKDSKIVELNLRGSFILGKERSALMKSSFLFFISEDTKHLFKQFIDKVFRNFKSESCEVTLLANDNTPIYVHIVGLEAEDREHCNMTVVDITERKLAELKLETSEERFRQVVEQTKDVVWEVDPSGLYTYVSKLASQTYGYQPEQLVGKFHFFDLSPEDKRELIKEELLEVFRKKESLHNFVSIIVRPDGKKLRVMTNGLPILDKKGILIGYRGIDSDISEQKRKEKILNSRIILSDLAQTHSQTELLQKLLDELELITDSHAGFVYLVGGDQKRGTLQACSTNTLQIMLKEEAQGHHIESESIWKDCCRQRKPVVKNNYSKIALQRRLNEGPANFSRKLAVPVFRNDMIVAVVELSRKPVDYDLSDIEIAILLAESAWDIVQRKQAEDYLQQTRQNYETFFNTIDDFLFILDVHGNMIHTNETVIKRLGYTIDELSGKSVLMVHPADRREEAATIVGEMLRGETISCHIPIVSKTGIQIPVETRVTHGLWNGNPAIFGVSKDITQIKLSEEKFSKVFYLNPSACGLDEPMTGKYIEVNDAFCALFGFEKNEVIGKSPEELGILTAEGKKDIYNKISESGLSVNIDANLFTKSGDVKNVLLSGESILVNDKMYRYTVVHDITDRMKAERILKASEEKYRTMLNASPDGILLIDLKGKITEVSEIGVELLGADTRNDLVEKHVSQFIPSDERAKLREIFEKTMNEGLVQNIELKINKKNKSAFVAETSVTLIQGKQLEPQSFMVIIRDISQRKKIETKQIHADRMASLGEMASGIAHEINQPLNIISMVMDKILFESSKTETIDIEFIKTKSERVFENIIRIRNIIDHVRAFSRTNEDYILTYFDVNKSIENAISMISEQFKNLGIDLKLRLGQQVPQIIGNTYQFEQVIINLLVNAKDAVVEKKTKNPDYSEMIVGIDSYQENSLLIVEVTDNGIGVNHDEINNIMLPFYTSKEEGKGTGLGLSICYQIIKEMNGNIEISSDMSFGTKIKLVLNSQKEK